MTMTDCSGGNIAFSSRPLFPLAYRFLVLLVVVLALPAMCAEAASAETGAHQPRRILILHSYAPDFSWTREMQAGILSVLEQPGQALSYRVEYLDAKHHDSPAYLEQVFRLYQEKYRRENETRFDGIILTDDHALEFVARHREALFPATPMVACGVNDARSIPANAGDMNIIIERVAHLETLNAALRQNPATHTIHVAVDNTLTGQSIRQDFLTQTEPLARRVRLDILPLMSKDELL